MFIVKLCTCRNRSKVLKSVFKISGLRKLIRKIRSDSTRCRLLNKKSNEVEMGPYPAAKTTITPPFYNSKVDIALVSQDSRLSTLEES